MDIIPKLNLNTHPKNIDNYSLVDAVNLMLSKDGMIQTEHGANVNYIIYDAIYNKYNNKFKIIYCIECNIELIIFVQQTDKTSDLSIFRYNEEENKCIFIIDNFKYNNGKLLGTFTYNKDKLIIAISEYFEDDSNKIPLRVLNLGEFKEVNYLHVLDYDQLNNNDLHYILPKVIIPNIETNIISGNAHKGWHFIFIRYKISHNTYTNWFNTNESVYLDSYSEQNIMDYYVPQTTIDEFLDDQTNNAEEIAQHSYIKRSISDDTDISDYSYIIHCKNLDKKYIAYQIGIIIISKEYSKCFYSEDINIGTDTIKYYNFKDYAINDILTQYNNYYNVKTLETYNNKLFIGNYLEHENFIDTKNINLVIGGASKNTDNPIIIEDTISKQNFIVNTTNRNWKLPIHYYSCENPPFSNNAGLEGGVIRAFDNNELIFNKSDSYSEVQFVYIICELYKVNDNNAGQVPYGYRIYKFNFNRLVNIKGYNGAKALGIRRNPGSIEVPWVDYFQQTIIGDIKGFDPSNPIIRIAITNDEINILKSWFPEYNWDSNEIEDYIYEQGFIGEITNYIPKYSFSSNNWDWDNPVKDSSSSTVIGTNFSVINSCSINFNEYYNFYIHFINQYGEITKGYNISEFNYIIDYDLDINTDIEETLENECNIEIIENLNKNKLVILKSDKHYQVGTYNDTIKKYYLKFKLDSIPKDYIGYFVSYEKLDKNVIYFGYGKGSNVSTNISYIDFYCEKFNYDDAIDFNFNTIILSKYNKINDFPNYDSVINNNNLIMHSTDGNIYEFEIVNKELFVADAYNNAGNGTYLKIQITTKDSSIAIDNEDFFCVLINDNAVNKYCGEVKTLIPCSQINYNINNSIIVNTKDAFYSKNSILKYYEEGVLFDTANFIFKIQNEYNLVLTPYYFIKYDYPDSIPMESISFNNKPAMFVFPTKGFTGVNDKLVGYAAGVIVEPKNSIDLFKQKQMSYYEAYPTTLNYYNPNIINVDKYPKTIRRSDAILDESYEISWRKFKPDVYKNIKENKGNIIKICNSGNILLIHTEYSLFIFDNNDSIKSENDKIQLASIDIWDVNYKELFSSKLGFGGLSKEHHSIIGDFGYIWFDAQTYNLYRLDQQFKFLKIDNDIINFISDFKPIDIKFTNDIKNNRILVKLINSNSNIVLSYNTQTNTFISKHTYNYNNSFNTKNKIYLLDETDKKLVNFNGITHTNYEAINKEEYQNYSYIDIICKSNYENIKFLESIQYKINKNIKEVYTFFPVKEFNKQYAGDIIRIYSEFCDSEDLDIIFEDVNEINNITNYTKPYWYLGNWHFNAIRNKLNKYLNTNSKQDEHSRIYGNYFIMRLIFKTNECVNIESCNFIYSLK